MNEEGVSKMARRVFTSFHFANDYWRAQQVRNMGKVEGNSIASANDWEEVKKKGDAAIRRWIDGQMEGKSCVIVLVGSDTAERKWIRYEITKALADKRGLFGIHIHRLKDQLGNSSTKGANPFSQFELNNGDLLSDYVKCYDPPGFTSTKVYDHIKTNIQDWIESAVVG